MLLAFVRSHSRHLHSNRIKFLFGFLLIPVLFLATVLTYSVVDSTTTTPPETAELEYASYSSVTGSAGGSIVPASCESSPQIAHFPGDLDGCTPPPAPTGLTASCVNHTVRLDWVPTPRADNYQLRADDVAVGMIRDQRVGRPHDIGGLYGSNYSWSVQACNAHGCSAATAGPNFSCAAPTPQPQPQPTPVPPPTGVSAVCRSDGELGTLTWTPPGGYTSNIRVSTTPGNPSAGTIAWRDNMAGGIAYFLTDPNITYYYWVETFEPATGRNSTPVTGQVTCPAQPVIPPGAPTGLRATCSPNGTTVDISWNSTPGVSAYLPRIRGVSASYCEAAGWSPQPNGDCINNAYSPWTPYATFAITPNTDYTFWVHNGYGGIPVTSLSEQATIGFNCPVSSASIPRPTNQTGWCSADGTTGNLAWTRAGGYSTVHTRVNTVGVGIASNYIWSGTLDNYVGSSISFPTTPGRTYYYWVETVDTSLPTPNWSPYVGGSFTCPINPVANLTYACHVSDLNRITFSWNRVAPATGVRFHLRDIPLERCPWREASYFDGVTCRTYWAHTPNSLDLYYDASWGSLNMEVISYWQDTPGGSVSTGVFSCPVDACTNITGFQATAPSGMTAAGRICQAIDVCPNMSGTQATVPSGRSLVGGNCVLNDVCPNIPGDQATVPSDRTLVGGNCVFSPPVLSLTAESDLVRRAGTATLTYNISALYPNACTITGGGMTPFSINHTGPVSTYGSMTTNAINATTIFTLTCTPGGAAAGTPSSPVQERVDVVPTFEER